MEQGDLLTHQVELLGDQSFETARVYRSHWCISHDRSRSLNRYGSGSSHCNRSALRRRSRTITIGREAGIKVGDERVDVGEVSHQIAQGEIDAELIPECLADLGQQEGIEAELEIRGVTDQFLFRNAGEIGEDSADRSGDRSAAAGGFGHAHNVIGKGDLGGAGLDRRGESRWGIGQGLGIDPVSFAFERIGRQRHALARFGSVEGTPVDLDSGSPEFPERFEGVGVVAARFLDVAAGGKGEVSGFAIERLAHDTGEGRAGPDFEEELLRLLRPERGDGPMEAHRLSEVFRPVERIGRLLSGQPCAGDSGKDRNAGAAQLDVREFGGELCDDRIHHPRVEGVPGLQ